LASVLQPSVLIAIPLLVLVGLRGVRQMAVFLVVTIAMWVTLSGPRDGIWFIERAWALLLAGWFVGATQVAPQSKLSVRTMAAVGGSVAVAAVFMLVRSGAWEVLDWVVSDALQRGVAMTLDAWSLVMAGRPVSPALASAMYDWVEAQGAVFPALLAIASMAALAVAWWIFVRISGGGDQGIGPVSEFRFNDHLVWVLIGGLLLVVVRWGDAVTRVGANAVVFMSALYALRGAGVVMFLSGGFSLLGYLLFAFGLVVAFPLVLGVAVLIGVGDTWLDLRARVGEGTEAR
jgi:hypothetical protein